MASAAARSMTPYGPASMTIRSSWLLLAAIHADGPLGAGLASSCSRQESASGTAFGRLDAGTNDERLRFDLRDGMRGITVIPLPPPAPLRDVYTYRDVRNRESLRQCGNFLSPTLRVVRAGRRKPASGHGGVDEDEQECTAIDDGPPRELQGRLSLLRRIQVFRRRRKDALSGDEDAVGVDSQRRARDEGHEVAFGLLP